jgi:hypothetical protein
MRLKSREPEIRQEVSVLRDKTKELSDKLYLKWKPTTKYILDAFDQRIIGIKKHKEKVVVV